MCLLSLEHKMAIALYKRKSVFILYVCFQYVCKSMVGVDDPMQWFSKKRQWPISYLSQESKLNVYFMSKCPEKWKYAKKVITPECIMDILDDQSSWHGCFTITQSLKDSHVRVAFQGAYFVYRIIA